MLKKQSAAPQRLFISPAWGLRKRMPLLEVDDKNVQSNRFITIESHLGPF